MAVVVACVVVNEFHQVALPEARYADELAFLAAFDQGPKPPGWLLTPQSVVRFICGEKGLRLTPAKRKEFPELPQRLDISPKFIGNKALIERCVVTLAGSRALMLVGEPGTAKSMLSELLSAAICGSSELTVQGSAGTTEDQLRYGWNYAMLLAHGPSEEALVPSPVLQAMTTGKVARIEEITRCQPEVQDSIVPILSERRMAIPELGEHSVAAIQGFCVIATANLRDKGVSEMSAALKRRFNFEHIDPIADRAAEISLVTSKTKQVLEEAKAPGSVDAVVVDALVTIFRDLRGGITPEGWAVEKPGTVMSTAEAVAISSSIALSTSYFPDGPTALQLIPGHLLGAVRKDDDKDAGRLQAYWDAVIRRRTHNDESGTWRTLWEAREDVH
ncbi:AAA family ATPase [Corynebacterium freiburgense]|uniref:ATP-binding protein n=1 Tax=Corynebacterium freiburgense TaxID=556548 RepID=UPI003F496ADF